MKIENICPLCEQNVQSEYLDQHQDGEQTYKLYQCPKCDAQFWLPLKNPGANWYEHDERYAGRNIDPIIKPNWNHKKIISFLKGQSGKVLDVGCGVGTFLKHAHDHGWQTFGLDFDQDAIQAAKQTFKLENLEVCDLITYHHKNPNSTFKLITFFDVFEHIDNHNEFISTVYNLLEPGGFVAMSMPYRKGFTWLKPHDYPPRHLTRWDRHSLGAYLENKGFQVLLNKRLGSGYTFILMKLRFHYGKLFSFNLVGKIKNRKRRDQNINLNSSAEKVINRVQTLARIKDLIIFGLPALIIYLALFFTNKRYVTLYVIAQKKYEN